MNAHRTTDDQALWRELLTLAASSPSPHNVQPWRARIVSADEAELYIDHTRTLPDEDLTGSFLLAAMGMFLEALTIAAADRKMRLEAEIPRTAAWFAARISDRSFRGLTLFARLMLVADAEAIALYVPEVMLSRRTSRLPLRPEPVPQTAVDALTQMTGASVHTYTHITQPSDIEAILDRNITAVFHDMNVPRYHDEITSWFRFTDAAAEQHRDGLDWRCMNLSRAEFWMSARMPRMLQLPLARAVFRKRYRQQLGPVPTIGILCGDFFTAEKAVDAGRFLLRFWLEAARLDLYMHPYGNMVTNPEAKAWLEARTGVSMPWLVFKLGYSDVPPRSHRRNLDDILLSTTGGANA